ncbi:MAG: hypothetical protein LBL59_11990 [Xanthomonadaceae bacterium]|nr:hypothetical protein [Xanthomonadaceae bacterium]
MQGWPYGAGQAQALAASDTMAMEWPRQARPFFQRLALGPDDFCRLLDDAALPPQAYHALDLAMIAAKPGDTRQAQRLAQAGLETCPKQAVWLRAKPKRMLERTAPTVHAVYRAG